MKIWIGCYYKAYPKLSWRMFTVLSGTFNIIEGMITVQFKETGRELFTFPLNFFGLPVIIPNPKFHTGDKVRISGSPYDKGQTIKTFNFDFPSGIFYIFEDSLPYHEDLLELVSRDLKKYRPCKNQCQD